MIDLMSASTGDFPFAALEYSGEAEEHWNLTEYHPMSL